MSKIIVIDAGHGGKDSGANANGLYEKNINLTIARLVKEKLDSQFIGHETKLTRAKDKFISLIERSRFSNRFKTDLFVSIHVNAGGGTGFESYIFNGGGVSRNTITAQNVIHAEIMKMINVRDRGKKKANFSVLRETRASAILTENLFIDRKTDVNKLKDSKFLNDLAQGHVNGIARHLKLEKKKVPKINKKVFYRVVTGSFNNKVNAEKRVKDLEKKGFKSFIDIYRK